MKVLFSFIFLIMLSGCKSKKNDLTTSIKEVVDINNLNINLDDYQNHDVDVFKTTTENRIFYSLSIFRNNRNNHGKLKMYSAIIVSAFTYENAVYEWINDSTVTFNLINKFHNHETYTVSGYGGTTALITD